MERRRPLCRFVQQNGFHTREHASSAGFLEAFDPESTGCVILDVEEPGAAGLVLQEQLTARHIEFPVLIQTAHADVSFTLQAWRSGTFDLLPKPVNHRALLDTVRRAVTESLRTRDQRILRERIRRLVSTLTPREHQVMALVVAGNANKVIGSKLGLSQKTIEVHRSHVMQKMGARSLPALVRMVMLIEDDPAAILLEGVGEPLDR